MRRIIYDVGRWSIFLHRDARGLPPVDVDDARERQLEDELFERLFAGEVEPLAPDAQEPTFRDWAERLHATCEKLPAFTRLSTECRGDADAAAIAVEELLDHLRPHMDDAQLRWAARAGCSRAADAVEQLRDATVGLEHVGFGCAAGVGTVRGEQRDGAPSISLACRLRDDARLRRIAQLAGRFKRIAAAKRRMKVRHGADEISDVEQGADLGRLLPAELAKLVHPKLRLAMLRDLSERRCLQYALTGTETLGKGPLVVCIDKSGSMSDAPDVWATAVALALLDVAQRERRPFAMLSFDDAIKHEAIVPVGDGLPEAALFVSCGGGTDIANVIDRGLDIIEQHPGALRKADVVLISDGGSNTERADELKHRAASLGVSILGVGIGIDAAVLAPWCDEAQCISQLETLDDKSAQALFGQ